MTHPDILTIEANGYLPEHPSKRRAERREGFECGFCKGQFYESFFAGPFWSDTLRVCVCGECKKTNTNF